MTRAALVSVLVVLAACATSRAPVTGRPPIPPGIDESHLHFADATVAAGEMAPDFTLPTADGYDEISLSSLRGRPAVLVFGSHTCNVFARDIPGVRRLVDE